MAISIDTTAVNWGLAKITHAFESIAPTMSGLTHDFVAYMVTRQVISSAMWSVLAITTFIIMVWVFVKSIDNGDMDEAKTGLGFMSFSLCIISVIVFVAQLSNLILAIKYPVIFAIMHTVK